MERCSRCLYANREFTNGAAAPSISRSFQKTRGATALAEKERKNGSENSLGKARFVAHVYLVHARDRRSRERLGVSSRTTTDIRGRTLVPPRRQQTVQLERIYIYIYIHDTRHSHLSGCRANVRRKKKVHAGISYVRSQAFISPQCPSATLRRRRRVVSRDGG